MDVVSKVLRLPLNCFLPILLLNPLLSVARQMVIGALLLGICGFARVQLLLSLRHARALHDDIRLRRRDRMCDK